MKRKYKAPGIDILMFLQINDLLNTASTDLLIDGDDNQIGPDGEGWLD